MDIIAACRWQHFTANFACLRFTATRWGCGCVLCGRDLDCVLIVATGRCNYFLFGFRHHGHGCAAAATGWGCLSGGNVKSKFVCVCHNVQREPLTEANDCCSTTSLLSSLLLDVITDCCCCCCCCDESPLVPLRDDIDCDDCVGGHAE